MTVVQGSGDTRDQVVLNSLGGVQVLEGDLSKHQQALGRDGEGGRAEEGGLGIMKESAVDAPDG
jgi:hypothetical protein